MPGMKGFQELDVTKSKFDLNNALEGVLYDPVPLQANWDSDYGDPVQGHAVYHSDIVNNVVRPVTVGVVSEVVNATTVKVAKRAALGQGLVGETLTKIASDGTVTDLAVSVTTIVKDDYLYQPSTITFSGNHGLSVGDVLGSVDLTADVKLDGVVYVSADQDIVPGVSIAIDGIFRTDKICAPNHLAKLFSRIRVRRDLTILAFG